ncbi:MAG: intermembrane transport protein PqiB [Steroidobacteraceae bacterium]
MAEGENLNELPQASIERPKRLRISVVWVIPILAAVVAIGIAIQRVSSVGPTVTIIFKAAAGIEAGKTFIKYKDVTIGHVTAVELTRDYSQVLVTAQIEKHAAGLIVEDAKFWVVQPTVTLSGVTGLNTLLSGQYIGFQAGKSTERGRHYIALDVPPVITDQPGRRFTLRSNTLGSLGVGAPLYYRSLPVGEVAAYSLAADGNSIEATVFIDAPYDKYVTSETRFWNASGIDISMGANGVDIRTESIVSVLVGGIGFDVPDFAPPGQPVAANAEFPLYQTRALAMTLPDTVERRFVLYFNESLRGLSVGAPVTLFGLPVGHVAEVGLGYDPVTHDLRPRVLVTFNPERLAARVSGNNREYAKKDLVEAALAERVPILRHLVEDRGLRARLQTGNLLTGELFVAFEYVPNAPKAKVDWSRDPLELPVDSSGFASILAKLDSILTKIDSMPLEATGVGVKNAIATLNQTLKQTDALLGRVDAEWVPEGTKTMEALHQAIADADRSLLNTDAPASQDLHDMMQELTRTARAVRVFVDYLQRHPSTLIRGKKEDNP